MIVVMNQSRLFVCNKCEVSYPWYDLHYDDISIYLSSEQTLAWPVDLRELVSAHDPPQSCCNKQNNTNCKVVKAGENSITIVVNEGMIK